MCNHKPEDLVIKDSFSLDKAVKVTICKKCLEVINVSIHGKKASVWDIKDRRISRQNALSHAVQIAIHTTAFAENTTKENLLNIVKDIAQNLEEWVWR